jgi:3' terminal RNA ribose 2'-O-methyltransferase Hen1
MLLTISTTHQPATDLGYLLAKNPDRAQRFELRFGAAHVFYPQADEGRCTVALLLDIDPVGLVRGRGKGGEGLLDQYVNDRPYVASSFMSVAIGEVFSTAMSGRSRERPELAERAIPLEAELAALPVRGGEPLLRRLFEPLGYSVEAEGHPLDQRFPEWGESRYFSVRLRGLVRLSDLLAHLYVLIPVLDAEKHYYFGPDEIDKLLRRGAGWLVTHPERALITGRYLRRPRLVREALARLVADEEATALESEEAPAEAEEMTAPQVSLHQQRLLATTAVLKEAGAQRVLDLGCGEGRLIAMLVTESQFTEILGMDVSSRALAIAQERIERLPPLRQQRVRLIQGSLTYRDARLHGYDGAAVVEVVEHLDPPRLAAFERVLFEAARPGTVALTTPNAEYNIRYPTLASGSFRHADHRFEWTRAELRTWAEAVAARFGYRVRVEPVGPEDSEVGAPSQLAIFTREGP